MKKNEIIKAGGIPKQNALELRHNDFKRLVDERIVGKRLQAHTTRFLQGNIMIGTSTRSGIGTINVSRYFISNDLSYPFGDKRIDKYLENEKPM